jgi:hypothetical protein
VKITTNNVPRDLIEAHELTEHERAEFDYLNWPAIDRGEDSATFVRYHGVLYDLAEFLRTEHTAGPADPRATTRRTGTACTGTNAIPRAATTAPGAPARNPPTERHTPMSATVTIYHNVHPDHGDGYQPGHDVVQVFTYADSGPSPTALANRAFHLRNALVEMLAAWEYAIATRYYAYRLR